MSTWTTTNIHLEVTGAEWYAVVENEDGTFHAHRCDAALTQSAADQVRDVLAVVDRTTGEIVPVEELPGYRWCHQGGADEAIQSYQNYILVAPVVEAEAHLHEVAARLGDPE